MISLGREIAARADKIWTVLSRPPEVLDLTVVAAVLAGMRICIFDGFHGLWSSFLKVDLVYEGRIKS